MSQKEFEDFTVNVSDNNLMSYYGYDKFDGAQSDKDVAFMAYFLKKNTRQIDLTTKQITYNDLNALINKRGMYLDNPRDSRINLMLRVELDGTHLSAPKRIAKIGFHGWSREVSRRDIDIVREASKLDARHGYDSRAFFNGLHDPLTLIKKYKEPLERLAFR